MSDVLVYVLLAVMGLVLLDALVLAGVVLARWVRRRCAGRAPIACPAILDGVATVLYAVPPRQDPTAALAALAGAGYPALVDPLDDRLLLISCPRGAEYRDAVRAVLGREAHRPTRTPGHGWSEPVRFSDDG